MKISLNRWSDKNGLLFETGKDGQRFYLISITPAFESNAGKQKTSYFDSEEEYNNFDPDPSGELEYHFRNSDNEDWQ